MVNSSKKTDSWQNFMERYLALPGHPPFDADHSIVYTLDESMAYYPVTQESIVNIQTQIIYIGVYCAIWLFVIIAGSRRNIGAYVVGFLVGFSIFLLEAYYYSMITNVAVIDAEGGNPYPYISNVPAVENVEKGTPVKDKNRFISYRPDSNYNGFKVLFENKHKPADDENGYLYTASTFLEKSSLGEFKAVDFSDYINGITPTGLSRPSDMSTFNPGTQSNVSFDSDRVELLSRTSYYIGIIIITWAMYVTTSPWGSIRQLYWNILAFMVAVVSGAIIVDTYREGGQELVFYIKKRLLILAISFGVTSIFVL